MASPVSEWCRRLRGEDGSMTLEASLVFPWVLISTLLLILFSLAVVNKAALYYSASAAGERSAFAWSHSAGNVRTGAYPAGAYDSLYWRLKDDAMLAGLFGWTTEENGSTIAIEGSGDERALAAGKLRRAASTLPLGLTGTMSYRNRIWLRDVSVKAAGAPVPMPLERLWGLPGGKREVSVAAVVTEPAEWIRTFELLRYYREKMRRKGQGAETYRSEAAAVLGGRG